MKRILFLLISLISFSAFAQPGSLKISGVFVRVQDSAAYESAAATAHSQGYADIFYNEQSPTPHFKIWNGSSYTHVFDFNAGGGGTPTLQQVITAGSVLTGNNEITGPRNTSIQVGDETTGGIHGIEATSDQVVLKSDTFYIQDIAGGNTIYSDNGIDESGIVRGGDQIVLNGTTGITLTTDNTDGIKVSGGGTLAQTSGLLTKAQVGDYITSRQFKKSVKASSTANIADLNNAGASMDGITLATQDRVLLKDQSTGSQNGIYSVVSLTPTVLNRVGDFSSSTFEGVLTNTLVLVDQGTTNGGKAYRLSTTGAITIGTTALTFTEFGGGDGSGITYSDVLYCDDSVKRRVSNFHYGKSIVWYGDSYILGTGASSNAVRLSTLVCDYLGATEVNNAVGGTTIEKRTPINWFGSSPNMVDNATNIPDKTASLSMLIIGYGVNDVGYAGGDYNTTNYITDYKTVIDSAISKGWSTGDILIISPWFVNAAGYTTYNGLNGTTPTRGRHLSFVQATNDVARYYGIHYLDAFHHFKSNDSTQMNVDGIHPNDAGHRFLANDIINYLNNGQSRLGNIKSNNVTLTSTTGTNDFQFTTYLNAVTLAPVPTTNFSNFMLHPRGAGAGGVGTQFVLFKTDYSASQSNYEGLFMQANTSGFTIASIRAGTGVQQPIIFRNQATDVLRLTTSSNVNVGTSTSDLSKLYVLQAAQTTAWVPTFRVDPGAHTGMTANTEFPNFVYNNATQTQASGTTATQRNFYVKRITYAGTTATRTITNAYGVYVEDAAAGTNGAITNNYALGTDGNIALVTAGNGIYIKEGSDATMGVATLSGGTVTVSTTKVTANSRIQLTVQSLGTVAVPMAIGVTARTAGTSFTITSADGTDTSVVAWTIFEPAP